MVAVVLHAWIPRLYYKKTLKTPAPSFTGMGRPTRFPPVLLASFLLGTDLLGLFLLSLPFGGRLPGVGWRWWVEIDSVLLLQVAHGGWADGVDHK